MRPPAPQRRPPAHGPGRGRRAALRRAARSRGAAAVALPVRTSPPAPGARARRPPSPSRLAGGGAVFPRRPRRSLELGGARLPGPAEARGAGPRCLCRRRRRGGHDRGAERAAAERGAEGEASPRAGAAQPGSSFRRAAWPASAGSSPVSLAAAPASAAPASPPLPAPRRPTLLGGEAPSSGLCVESEV